jgi:hypothetical protein
MATGFCRNVVRCCALFAVLLSGCGGSDDPPPPPAASPPPASPAVVIAPTSVIASGNAATSSAPTASVTIGITNPPAGGVYVGYSYSYSGIDDAHLQATSSTSGEVLLSFKNPAVIGPGVYSDTITVQVCLDSQCVTQVDGSPRTIDVTYTVTGVQAPQPALTLSSTNLNVQGVWFASTQTPGTQLTYSIANATNQYFNIDTSYTSNAIQYVYRSSTSGGGYDHTGTITINFKPPSELTQGTYNDVITVTASCGYSCPRGIANGVQQIAVQYELGNTLSGVNGITARAIPIIANDIAWNSDQSRIYLAAPSSAGVHANSVVVLNPSSATIESSSFAGSEPATLALSDDNQYLYVALNGSNSVRRKLVPSLAQDILIPMGNASNGDTLLAGDIQVAPGQPQTLAVVKKRSSQYSSDMVNVSIYDGITVRSNVAAPTYPYGDQWLQWSGPTRLYSSASSSPGYLSTLDVDANGVALASSQTLSSSATIGRIQIAGGVLYTSGGEAFDPVTRAKLGTYTPAQYSYPRAVIADPQLNKLFMIANNGSTTLLLSYNLTTFAPIASVQMNRLGFSSSNSRLIRWGTDGLAFVDVDTSPYNAPPQGRVMLITGPFVSNPTN